MTRGHSIQKVLEKMMETVGDSREKIFEIGEESRTEYNQLKTELARVQSNVIDIIERNERMEVHSRFARNRLSEVSKQFGNYSDEEVRKAYEQANDYQVQLAILRQEEKQLRERRDQIERRLVKLKDTVERAETLVSQINVVINYLTGDLKQVTEMVEDAVEMQKFGLKIILAQEEERKRLSREIHDGPAQMMANVMIRSELVERVYVDKGIDEALKEIHDLRKMVGDSLAEVRRIIYDLRPMALDDLGLVPTLKRYLKHMEERTKTIITFKSLGKERRLPTDLEIALFRFVQEAVQNANKHASATRIDVKLELTANKALVIIKDDGIGFNPNEKKEGSFGLLGMRERVNMLDGEIGIDSKAGAGTLIMVQVPINKTK
ncbi:sensor histidine kinase [Evansella cellulosilytica]|uniref:Signal transduction histidine-protein kinase/phosphatase DegS n=1 Tax=Evansella cellulosilytica (strain ATCC 21833 / DSM 2522 / FERM P-1141 / JCM 9156 / N-4) TaxID=649639 RepID=E6TSA5_EVAC2|nr:sensor histidine kinase [Evansella cellulosilytica]ADU31874.1 DegS sensor signal transduction histidine kinase [Evansella cellulosilytica DSM 2522]